VTAAASNPAVQNTAKAVAKDKAVQKAVVNAAINANTPPSPSHQPSWAQETYRPPAVPGSGDLESASRISAAQSNHPPNSGEVLNLSKDEEDSLRSWHNKLRILYSIGAIIMGVAAGLSLVSQTNVAKIFFALYVLAFCLLMCCNEQTYLKSVMNIIASNFGFLYTLGGRIIFCLFVGFMSFSLGTFGIVAMAILYSIVCLHIYVLLKFPNYETYVRQKHYYNKE
jgi:hypothetical protein